MALLDQGGIVMRGSGFQGQAQQQRKISPMVAGLGAAVVASAVTLVIMMSSPSPSPVAVADQAATASTQCQMVPRKLLVSTTVGSGPVRLRPGSFLSPPIPPTPRPHPPRFPLPPPQPT